MKRKNIVFKALTCGLASLAFTACTDTWETHYQPKPELNASETLWDLIQMDPELNQFEAFVKETGYDEVLKQNRFYTIWAPVDGSEFYTSHPLEGISDSMLNVYKTEFVENHIADYNHTASGTLSKNKVKMLNGKYNTFEGSADNYTFKNTTVTTANIAAKNGLLHKVNTNAIFTPNIWEQLAKEPSVALLNAFLKSYDEITFDRNSSVEGPTIDGQVTYLDSVFEHTNEWFNRIGKMNREDSSYIMFALTDKAWTEAYDNIKNYFVYDETVTERDSLQDLMTKDYMCARLGFSQTIQKDMNDSLISISSSNYGNNSLWYKKYVYKDEEYAHMLDQIVESKELSNGVMHIVDNFIYKNFWHDTIRVQGESLYGAPEGVEPEEYETAIKGYGSISKDSVDKYYQISGGRIGIYEPEISNSNPKLTFTFKNVLSAKYRVKIVFVPKQFINWDDTLNIMPNKYNATLTYRNEKGKKTTLKLGTNLVNNPYKVDTVTLVPDKSDNDIIEFPVNELGIDATSVMTQLKIEGKVGARDKNYDRVLRVDQVFLEPVIEE